jgi:hypothetical protein
MMVPSPCFFKLKTGYSNTKVSLAVNWSNIDTKQISFPFNKFMPLSVLLRFCYFRIIFFAHNERDNIYLRQIAVNAVFGTLKPSTKFSMSKIIANYDAIITLRCDTDLFYAKKIGESARIIAATR